MNGPVIVIQTTLFPRDYNYRVAYVFNSLPTKYCLYLLKLISIFGHFLTVNNRRYGHCYIKFIISLCTFLELYTQLEANSAKWFQNASCKCSRALSIMFLKTSYFSAYRATLSPIYTAKKFWHGSDEKSTRTKKIGSAQIDFVM